VCANERKTVFARSDQRERRGNLFKGYRMRRGFLERAFKEIGMEAVIALHERAGL